ncbi:MAG: hypothetical protein ABL921_31500, partial [Pirellula sp.]
CELSTIQSLVVNFPDRKASDASTSAKPAETKPTYQVLLGPGKQVKEKTYGPFDSLKLTKYYTKGSAVLQGIFITGSSSDLRVDLEESFLLKTQSGDVSGSLNGFRGQMSFQLSSDGVSVEVITGSGKQVSGMLAFVGGTQPSDEIALVGRTTDGLSYAFKLKNGVKITSEKATPP